MAMKMRFWMAWILGSTAALACLAGCASKAPVVDGDSQYVYVVGSVNKQVRLKYVEKMTLLEALSEAGFVHSDALQCYVRWVDKSGPIIKKRRFSYSALVSGGQSNSMIHRGDIIRVYRHPLYAFMDFLERMLQPVRSLLPQATNIASAG